MSEFPERNVDNDNLPEWAEQRLRTLKSKDIWREGNFVSNPRDVELAKQIIDEFASRGVRLAPVRDWLRQEKCADRDYKTFMDYASPRLM